MHMVSVVEAISCASERKYASQHPPGVMASGIVGTMTTQTRPTATSTQRAAGIQLVSCTSYILDDGCSPVVVAKITQGSS